MSGFRSGQTFGPRLVTKQDTASSISLGSATVTADNGSANTYGSWTQLIASTAADSHITTLAVTINSANPPAATDWPVSVQLGTGSAAAEVVKFERIAPLAIATAGHTLLIPLDVPFRVSAGRRVTARIKVQSTNARTVDVTVYGLPVSQTEGN